MDQNILKLIHLAKDTIFIGDINGDASTSGDAAYILKIKRVPKRYTVEREPNGLIQLGLVLEF